MRAILLSFIAVILFSFDLYGQLITGRAFDNRFENHTKEFKLFGKVKSVKETDSLRQNFSKYMPQKRGIEYVLVWDFNPDGNYKEITQYKSDGSIAMRYVFNYNSKGQLTTCINFDGLREKWRMICTIDLIHNTARSESYYTGSQNSYASELIIYDKQGKMVKQQFNLPPKYSHTTKYTYDKDGNSILIDTDGSKTVRIFDKNNFVIEETYYNEAGKIFMHSLYKKDQWGNTIEETNSTYDNEAETWVTQYIYDEHNNWIKKTTTSKYDKLIKERAITYY